MNIRENKAWKNQKRLFQSFFSPIYIPTNRGAPFFAYKHLQPTIHPNRSDEGLNARNVSFKTFTVANLRYQLNL